MTRTAMVLITAFKFIDALSLTATGGLLDPPPPPPPPTGVATPGVGAVASMPVPVGVAQVALADMASVVEVML